MKLFIVVFSIFLLTIIPLSSQTVYISPTGSDNNPGSRNFPLKTLKEGLLRLPSSGGSILLIAGINDERDFYEDKLDIYDNVIIKSENSANLMRITKNGNGDKLLFLRGNNSSVESVILYNIVGAWPIFIEGNYNKIYKCQILGCEKDGISIIGGNHNEILYNYLSIDTLYSIGRPFANSITVEGKFKDNIFRPASYNLIKGNFISETKSHFGINLFNTYDQDVTNINTGNFNNIGNIICNNYINKSWSGIYMRKQKDFEIYNNIIRFPARVIQTGILESYEGHGINIDFGPFDNQVYSANGKIYNNLFYDYLNCGIWSKSAYGLKIYNNVFLNNMNWVDQGNGDEFIRLNYFYYTDIQKNMYFKNNNGDLWNDPSFKWYYDGPISSIEEWVRIENNMVYPGNPFWADSAHGNFHTTYNSTVILNQGQYFNLNLASFDMDGLSRPDQITGLWDIGPYEDWHDYGKWNLAPSASITQDNNVLLQFSSSTDKNSLDKKKYGSRYKDFLETVSKVDTNKILLQLNKKYNIDSIPYIHIRNINIAKHLINDLTFNLKNGKLF